MRRAIVRRSHRVLVFLARIFLLPLSSSPSPHPSPQRHRRAGANTYPYIQVKNPTARVEHEASTSKIGEDQLFYFQQRGIDAEEAVGVIISGFCREVFNELPLEFAAEVQQLMSLKLEGSVG